VLGIEAPFPLKNSLRAQHLFRPIRCEIMSNTSMTAYSSPGQPQYDFEWGTTW